MTGNIELRRTRPPVIWEEALLRSLAFVSADDREQLKAIASAGPDAVVFDLEDAVTGSRNESVRRSARQALSTYPGPAILAARVNGYETGLLDQDVNVLASPHLDAIIVPKLESAEVLAEVDRTLASAERMAGLALGAIRLLGLIETTRGVVECEAIAAAAPARLLTFVFGTGDFSVDLRVDLTHEPTELLYARSRVAIAARAWNLLSAIDGPFRDRENLDGLAIHTRQSRQLGFQGRVVIDPRQIAPINEIYSESSPEEVEQARAVLEAFESGALSSLLTGNRLTDYPVYHRARQRLRLSEPRTRDAHQSSQEGE